LITIAIDHLSSHWSLFSFSFLKIVSFCSSAATIVVNILENKIDKILGKSESNLRFLTIGLYQGKIKGSVAAENLQRNAEQDPTLFCTAFKQQRFYMITRRDPYQEEDSEIGRDVFNERPSKAEASLLAKPATRKLGRSAILHTTMGDIHIKLFPEECPRTIENFSVHSKDGYYNNCIFHRVIKGFMIQTGDPLGTVLEGFFFLLFAAHIEISR